MAKRPAAAQTAFGPMVIVAVEQNLPEAHRLVHDELAVRFLPPALRPLVRACRRGSLRDLLVTATDRKAPGIWGGLLCRKRYADDQVAEALADGIGQLVVLGTGLDTKACRLAAPAGVPAFEIDLPANIGYKRDRLTARYGRVPEHVTLVPVDLGREDLAAALAAAGVRDDRPAVFVWEAVTQYLTEAAVRATLTAVSTAAPGSRLIFTYVRKDFLDGTSPYGAERLRRDFVVRRRVWHFGIDPDAVAGLLREHGWDEREQVGPAEYRARYLEPAGRDLPVSEIERFVLAVKPPSAKPTLAGPVRAGAVGGRSGLPYPTRE